MLLPKDSSIILGIDPGSKIMGYGVIKVHPKEIIVLEFDYLSLSKYTDGMDRMACIFNTVTDIIANHNPFVLAIEAPFFGKNVQSMLKLGRAQGIAIAAALSEELEVFEYAPKKVKQSITGNGNATKEQVALMLKNILKLETLPKNMDATDGLAVALCHHYQTKSLSSIAQSTTKDKKISKPQANSWEAFVNQNKGRVKGG